MDELKQAADDAASSQRQADRDLWQALLAELAHMQDELSAQRLEIEELKAAP